MPGAHAPLDERLWRKVREADDLSPNGWSGCWLWSGAISGGYGRLRGPDGLLPAHVVAYQVVVGAIPAGLELDHLCRRRACVNPAHLEPVTHRENLGRGQGPHTRTHCPQGHPLLGLNLYVCPDGWRHCRECRRAASRRSHQHRKQRGVV